MDDIEVVEGRRDGMEVNWEGEEYGVEWGLKSIFWI